MKSQVLARFTSSLVMLFASLTSLPAFADEFPSHPIRIIVPYAPGGGTDLLMRLLQQPLGEALGQPIVIENRSGAAGAIAAKEVAHSAPDGYTLLIGNNGSVVVPLLQDDAGYDFAKDLTAVTVIARTPEILIASKNVPANNLAELIAYAKKNPDGITCGSSGNGSLGHLAAALFAKDSNIKLQHVPYRGQNPTMMAVISGELSIAFTTGSDSTFEFVKAGKMKILGQGAAQPSALFPGVQPISSVLPGYLADVWQGIVAPAGTPPAVIAKLNAAFTKALANPDIQKKFAALSYTAAANTPAQFTAEINNDYKRWGAIIKEDHIRAE